MQLENDSSFEADFAIPQHFNLQELNDFIRDLTLSKEFCDLLSLVLNKKNLLYSGTNITLNPNLTVAM